MTPILVIWEEIPENTKVYLLEPENEDVERRILAAHRNIINSDEDSSAAEWLSKYLSTKQPILSSEEDEKAIPSIPTARLILSGFMT